MTLLSKHWVCNLEGPPAEQPSLQADRIGQESNSRREVEGPGPAESVLVWIKNNGVKVHENGSVS